MYDRKAGSLAGHQHPGQVGTIASLSYTTGVDVNISPTNSTSQDVDATNAVLTFTAPASGTVTVSASMSYDVAAPAGLYMSVREGSSDLAGTQARVAYIAEATTFPSIQGTATREWVITGLVPGSVHTYKLGCAKITGGGTATFHHGPSWGPLTMTIRA